ncbi:MAG: glycosyltransferase [Patescibacteria group bacterium]
MKIAEVVCTFPPYRGGIGNSVFELSKYLAMNGADVTVFTPNYQNIVSEYNEGFKVRRIEPVFQFGNAAIIPQLFGKLKAYGVIHLHLPFLGGTLPALFYLFFHPKKKLVLTYHMDLIGTGIKGLVFFLYKKIILPLALSRANTIVVSSFDYAENSDIGAYFKKHKKKFSEIPFGVDTARFFSKAKDKNLLEKYFITPKDKIILFVGGLDAAHYFKGLDILLRALKHIADSGNENFKLIVIGEGELKHDYQNMAESFNIARNVIFAGGVSNAELCDYYNLADVFVLPSINKGEAFGLVLLEAGACAKPVIASNLAGVRTLILENETGYLAEPGNPIDLAEKIKTVILNDDLARKMGENNRKRIEDNYKWERVVEKVQGAYGDN